MSFYFVCSSLRVYTGYINRAIKNLNKVDCFCGFGTHQLTRKDVEFNWSKECDDAFKRLKQKMSNSPVLGYYNPEEEFVLQVDSSEKRTRCSATAGG